ncbi:MAG: hypothetical protein OXH99_10570 [Bryobacterales bacterium]|nr:hypothetical protein [Bryobacterales bacterium]
MEHDNRGLAELALDIILVATGDRDSSANCHQQFHCDHVAPLPASGGMIPGASVRDSVERRAETGEEASK